MSAKEFDDLIRNKLSQDDFVYSHQDYNAMHLQLAEARQKKSSKTIWLLLTGIAACMLLLITISALSTHTSYPAGETLAKHTIKNNAPVQDVIAPLAYQKKEENKIMANPIAHIRETKQHNRKESKHKEPRFIPAAALAGTFRETKEKNNNINNKAPNQEPLSKNEHNNNINLASSLPVNLDMAVPAETVKQHNKKLDLSLAGGVNYGSANQGYLLGASLRKNLGDKLYVEGDLGYANSSTQTTVNMYSYGPASNAGFNASPPVITVKQDINTFSYLQLSPSIGYHIHKKIAVGLGADFQRLLQNSTVTTANNRYANGAVSETGKEIPGMDYGIICKTEYSISSRLKTGLQYREGMNNFLSGANKYFDRNYFQVQIKYSLFNK